MSDNLHLDPGIAAAVAKAAAFAPGFAGAVVSLAFVGQLTARGRILAVGVGFISAAFMGPGLAALADLAWPGVLPEEVRGTIIFFVGLCAMGCLPKLLEWAKRKAGDPLSLMKPGGPPDSGAAA